jgi:hypothetical protein
LPSGPTVIELGSLNAVRLFENSVIVGVIACAGPATARQAIVTSASPVG